MDNIYEVVNEFEKVVAEYAGAKYGVAVNSCSNAIMLSVKYAFMQGGCEGRVWIPKYTYVGVAYAILNAGGKVAFRNEEWKGGYELSMHMVEDSWGVRIIDSARRFRKNMYIPDTLYCLSFHWLKHLPVGRGGMILTDDIEVVKILKQLRYDGRTAGVAPKDDNFNTPGYHCYMIPEDAARGLMLMSGVKDSYPDIPWDDYADLSQYKIFKEGY